MLAEREVFEPPVRMLWCTEVAPGWAIQLFLTPLPPIRRRHGEDYACNSRRGRDRAWDARPAAAAPRPRSDWLTALPECRRLPNWRVPRRPRGWPGLPG